MKENQVLDFPDRMCSCGHPESSHSTESETVMFNGLFNPSLAGRVETYTWAYCLGDDVLPCSSVEHEIDGDNMGVMA